MCPPFAKELSFIIPKFVNKIPYGPRRFKELVKECFLISKNINTSYNDVLKMSCTEKDYILSFLVEEAKQIQENLEEHKREMNKKIIK